MRSSLPWRRFVTHALRRLAYKLSCKPPYQGPIPSDSRPSRAPSPDNVATDTTSPPPPPLFQYGVCVFRNTGLTDDAHVAFSRRLGALDDIRRYLSPQRRLRYEHVELFDAGNLDEHNRVVAADSPRAHANRGNTLFHVDSSFNPRRASFSLLRAVALPPAGSGGDTEFADSRAAFEGLPAALARDLAAHDYVGAHSMAHSRRLGSPAYFADLEAAAGPPMARHRLVQRHEPSGRTALYAGAHLHHVEGAASAAASAALVAAVNGHVSRAEYVLRVAWERPGDLVVWDNRCVQHRAVPGGSFEGRFARDLRRTTVHDDSPTAWGENDPGEPMPGFNYHAYPGKKSGGSGAVAPTAAAEGASGD